MLGLGWKPTHPEMDCTFENMASTKYEELSCIYSNTFGKTYMDWEINYDPVPIRDYMRTQPLIPIVACIIYGLWCYFGQIYFKERKPWSWRSTLAYWNLGLSLFSAFGFIRTAPQLIHNLTHYTLNGNVCNNPESMFGSASTGFWVQMFILSKFPELFDTYFIVIHKKPLIFLHWYHHITVLLYCWHSYVSNSPTGLFFVVMNYGVHSIMYGYYFLMAIKAKPKWMNAMIITIAQISQMIVGVAVTLYGFYAYTTESATGNDKCWIKMENNIAATIMYGSYLLLFLQFFLGRYFGRKNKKSLKKSIKKIE